MESGHTSWSLVIGAAVATGSVASLVTYMATRQKRRNDVSQLLLEFENPTYTKSPEAQRQANEFEIQTTTRRTDPFDPRPRSNYLSWDDYFMSVAFLSAQRSKDPNKQVGACIVDQNNVICGIGYNGFPRGCPDSRLPWAKRSRTGSALETKYPYVCHAEMNAILNKNGASVAGSRVYVTMFPCNECAKLLIQAGISEIVFHEDKAQPKADTPASGSFKLADQYAASKKLLELAGVKVRQHLFKRPVQLLLTNDHVSQVGLGNGAAFCSTKVSTNELFGGTAVEEQNMDDEKNACKECIDQQTAKKLDFT